MSEQCPIVINDCDCPIIIDDDSKSPSEPLPPQAVFLSTSGSPLKVVSGDRFKICTWVDSTEYTDPIIISEENDVKPDVPVITSQAKKRLKFSNDDSTSDPECPIFETPPAKYAAERILRILIDRTIPSSKICSKRPVHVQSSATFVVDITKLADPEDIKNDNFGAWKHSGSHHTVFKVNLHEDNYVQIEKCAPGATGESVVQLRRLHSVHPGNILFKRMIAFLSDSDNNPHHLALVTYRIPPGFTPVVKSHGNANSGVPFHPTWHSTKRAIRSECVKQGPKTVVSSLSNDAGGLLDSYAPGVLPRDEKHVSNYKARAKIDKRMSCVTTVSRDSASDDLFMVMQKCYSEDPSNKFVRAVNAAPEPAIVVATDRQLHDLSRFCTSSAEYSPLTVDPTFNVGEFDVTLITYRHLLLHSKRYKCPPIFIGPCCIHYRKTFSTYLFFASTLVGQRKELEGVRVLGTDGEVALSDAFKHEFGFSQHLTCSIHARRNVKDMLQKCNIPSQIAVSIVDDIFGKKIGSQYVNGLVDSVDTIDFNEKAEKLIDHWQNVSMPSAANIERFLTWFKGRKLPIVRDTMISSVREECGLGSPPSQFTTNACETANSMLKNHTSYKKSDLFEFLQKLRHLINEQNCEVERAIVGRGKYQVRPQYSSLQISEVKWFSMTRAQREAHIHRFACVAVVDVISSDHMFSSLPSSRTPSIDDASEPTVQLAVNVDDVAEVSRLPRNCLDGIWVKARELVNTENAIVPAPGVSNGKFVMSYSGQKPHLVTQKKNASFCCDDHCANWNALGVCAHSIAVANQCEKLSEFVTLFSKKKKTPALSGFVRTAMPKGRGRKGTQPPRKRKASVSVEQVVDNPNLGTAGNVPMTCISQMNVFDKSSGHQTNVPFQTTPPFGFPTAPTMGHQQMPFVSQAGYSTDYNPFVLCKISGNISVCAGCRNKYPKNPLPPDDLCIRHQEWREFLPAGSTSPQSRFGNVYYHFIRRCVLLRCPYFLAHSLIIDDDMPLHYLHKVRLFSDFQIYKD